MQFEYYVLNYDWNKKKVFHYNIFNNSYIQEWTEKAIKKYIRSPKNYTRPFNFTGDDIKYGFEFYYDATNIY